MLTPGKKSRHPFCRSRPFDQQNCVLGNPGKLCRIIKNGNCATMHVFMMSLAKFVEKQFNFMMGKQTNQQTTVLVSILEQQKNPASYPNKHYAMKRQWRHTADKCICKEFKVSSLSNVRRWFICLTTKHCQPQPAL